MLYIVHYEVPGIDSNGVQYGKAKNRPGYQTAVGAKDWYRNFHKTRPRYKTNSARAVAHSTRTSGKMF